MIGNRWSKRWGDAAARKRRTRKEAEAKADLEGLAQYSLRNPFSVEKMTLESPGDIVIYRSRLNAKINRNFEVLFQRERSVITKHIRNIFEEGELAEKAVCANHAHTAADGKTYQTVYYNLDVIISVGYRVKSQRGTQFATSLPTMLLFDDDLQLRQQITALFLQPQAYAGLGHVAKAKALLRSALRRDPNHGLAADLLEA